MVRLSPPTKRTSLAKSKNKMNIDQKATLLLSGGQDSFVSLLWAKNNFEIVEAVSISYGQRHTKELRYSERIANHFGILQHVVDIGDFVQKTVHSALTNTTESLSEAHETNAALPASFVPNRNGLFLTVACNIATLANPSRIHLVTGVCETDYSGYPDCRDSYIRAKSVELTLGLDKPVSIHTPLMWANKSEIFRMAAEYGHFNELIEMTLTCYNGIETLHEWGRGCGVCPSCNLRKEGYFRFKESPFGASFCK